MAQAEAEFCSLQKHYQSLGELVLSVEDEPLRTITQAENEEMRIIWGKVDKGNSLDDFEPWFGEIKHFEYWIGDPESAALFTRMKSNVPQLPKYIGLSNLRTQFTGDNLDTTKLLEVFCEAVESLGPHYLQSLKAIGTIDALYKRALRATVNVKVFQHPLREAQWLRNAHKSSTEDDTEDDDTNEQGHGDGDKRKSPTPREAEIASLDGSLQGSPRSLEEQSPDNLSHFFEEAIAQVATDRIWKTSTSKPRKPKRSVADWSKALDKILQPIKLKHDRVFSCVLIFESGQFNISPEQLRNVMAISSGDSLFITAPLLNDPAKPLADSEIYHVMGNIGRAGIALLVPPVAPRIKSAGIQHWNIVNRDYWDGQPRDCFQDTSLHLWFTGFSLPVDVGYSGAQDTELYILESVVSVHGSGKWVADLDVLKALKHPSLLLRSKATAKDSISPAKRSQVSISTCDAGHSVLYKQDHWNLLALENWMELLEQTSQNSILLAKGNWQARLAATSICIAQGRPVYLLSDQACWTCIESETAKAHKQRNGPIIFIG